MPFDASTQAMMSMTKRRGTPSSSSSMHRRACAVCSPSPCPACARGQMCQQVFRNKLDCTSCPSNVCVVDPNYQVSSSSSNGGGSKAGPIGGAVGGVIGALAVALVFFWIYRNKQRREEREAARRRVDAKLRAAEAEKFRPGTASKKTNSVTTAGSRPRTPASGFGTSFNTATPGLEDEEEEMEDVEWTEMRPDGLTTFKHPPGTTAAEEKLFDDQHLDVMGNPKRRSTGAATHLSAITEGAEEEEELRRRASIMSKMSGMQHSINNRNYGSTSSINLAHSGNSQHNPFSDAASIVTSSSGHTKIIPIIYSGSRDAQGRPSGPAQPERALRATGAPVIDLRGQQSLRVGATPSRVAPAGAQPVMLRGGAGGRNTTYQSSPLRPSQSQRDSDASLRTQSRTTRDSGQTVGSSILQLSAEDGHAAYYSDAGHAYDDAAYDTHSLVPPTYNGNRPLSAQTTNSDNSAYVLDSQVITPAMRGNDASKRITISQGKAQLVRTASQKHRDAAAGISSRPSSSRYSALNPFGDDARAAHQREEDYMTSPPSSATLAVAQFDSRPGSSGTFGGRAQQDTVDMLSVSRHSDAMSIPRSTTSDSLSSSPGAAAAAAAHHAAGEWAHTSAPGLGGAALQHRPDSSASLPFVEPSQYAGSVRSVDAASRNNYWTSDARSNAPAAGRMESEILPSPSASRAGQNARNAAASRQSIASSIGGLSVFDGIPFQVDSPGNEERALPPNAAATIAAARSSTNGALLGAPAAQPVRGESRLSDWVDEDPTGSDEEWDVADDDVHAVPRPAAAASSSPARRNAKKAPVATGATTDFESLRLQHELAQYPFAASSPGLMQEDAPESPSHRHFGSNA